MSGNFFKITDVNAYPSRRGDTLYSFLLDNKIKVSAIYPDEKWQSSGKSNRSIIYELNRYWKKSGNTLLNATGNYLVASLKKTEYGTQLEYVTSVDLVGDFAHLLNKNKGRAFVTPLPIYDFLKERNYHINNDDSISLQKSYSNVRVRPLVSGSSNSVCYPKIEGNEFCSIENISKIYQQFYAHLRGKGSSPHLAPDGDWMHTLNTIQIVKQVRRCRQSYKATHSGDIDEWFDEVVLSIGDKLTNEQKTFLDKHSNLDK
jgi:hypothetical protein